MRWDLESPLNSPWLFCQENLLCTHDAGRGNLTWGLGKSQMAAELPAQSPGFTQEPYSPWSPVS